MIEDKDFEVLERVDSVRNPIKILVSEIKIFRLVPVGESFRQLRGLPKPKISEAVERVEQAKQSQGANQSQCQQTSNLALLLVGLFPLGFRVLDPGCVSRRVLTAQGMCSNGARFMW